MAESLTGASAAAWFLRDAPGREEPSAQRCPVLGRAKNPLATGPRLGGTGAGFRRSPAACQVDLAARERPSPGTRGHADDHDAEFNEHLFACGEDLAMAGHINLPGQGLGGELADGSLTGGVPWTSAGPGAETVGPEAGNDLEMLWVTSRYRS
jgi:hypothetical protein